MSKNVMELDPTSTTASAWIEITIPDGIGGYLSRRISFETLAIAIKEGLTIERLTDISAAFTKAFDSGTHLLSIDFQYVSGSNVKIKVGTTLGGTEISLAQLPVPANGNLPLVLNYNFDLTDTFYIDVIGGVLNISFLYITNYL